MTDLTSALSGTSNPRLAQIDKLGKVIDRNIEIVDKLIVELKAARKAKDETRFNKLMKVTKDLQISNKELVELMKALINNV